MIDPRVVLVAFGVAATVWLGGESVKGLRWVKHHASAAIHRVVHPRDGVRK